MMYYFTAGGPVFMTLLTLSALTAVGLAVRQFLRLRTSARPSAAQESGINLVLHLGLFSFFAGILAQAIALMQAFQAIEAMGSVAPAMLMGGLRVSMIAPIYGLIILIVCLCLWAGLQYRWKTLQVA